MIVILVVFMLMMMLGLLVGGIFMFDDFLDLGWKEWLTDQLSMREKYVEKRQLKREK